jgi:hypothetical protein
MRRHGIAVLLAVAVWACTTPAPRAANDQAPQPSASAARVSPSPSTTPLAAAAAVPPPCAPGDVTGAFDHWGAAAGSYGGSFRLAPRSGEPCALPDHPITTFIDERGGRLRFVEPWPDAVHSVPVRAATGKDATFFTLLWSNHGGDVGYLCVSRTRPLDSVQIEVTGGPITLEFPFAERPTLCIEPRERVFVQVLARDP